MPRALACDWFKFMMTKLTETWFYNNEFNGIDNEEVIITLKSYNCSMDKPNPISST